MGTVRDFEKLLDEACVGFRWFLLYTLSIGNGITKGFNSQFFEGCLQNALGYCCSCFEEQTMLERLAESYQEFVDVRRESNYVTVCG